MEYKELLSDFIGSMNLFVTTAVLEITEENGIVEANVSYLIEGKWVAILRERATDEETACRNLLMAALSFGISELVKQAKNKQP